MADEQNTRLPAFVGQPVSDKEGNLTPGMQSFMDQFFQYMDKNLSHNGYKMPHYQTASITAFGSNDNVEIGTVWFDTTTATLKVKTASGTIREIQFV